jgi:hypothetical protein
MPFFPLCVARNIVNGGGVIFMRRLLSLRAGKKLCFGLERQIDVHQARDKTTPDLIHWQVLN